MTDAVVALAGEADAVVVAPIGFVSDHMEVVYDLDTQAADAARQAGIKLVRASTPGTHPAFVTMVRQLLDELIDPGAPRRSPRRSRDPRAPLRAVRNRVLPGDAGRAASVESAR